LDRQTDTIGHQMPLILVDNAQQAKLLGQNSKKELPIEWN